ncbi:hypothetical protein [Streptomyces wuyuanensis]|uniref:hypothetical protein n=1 Tax=Streptomyces wuyuanensis TaxID=1196353 RepID=UPI003416E996
MSSRQPRSCATTSIPPAARCTRETVHAITNLTSAEASPQRITQTTRSQRTIENRLHHVRDTTFTQNDSKHSPANLATLHNPAINTPRNAENRNNTPGLRKTSYTPSTHPHKPLGNS